MTSRLAPRRQARFLADRVIVPEGIEPDRWYDICQGRRRDDKRPGIVLLDLGPRRVTVPEAYLEFRTDASPRGSSRRWSRKAIAISAVPVGLMAVVAIGLLANEPSR